MQLTQDIKEEILNLIADQLPIGLEDGSIKEEELEQIAGFVLDKIENIQTEEELREFFKELAEKWPAFTKLKVIEVSKITKRIEDQAALDVLKLAREGKIDEAMSLAKSVTGRS